MLKSIGALALILFGAVLGVAGYRRGILKQLEEAKKKNVEVDDI